MLRSLRIWAYVAVHRRSQWVLRHDEGAAGKGRARQPGSTGTGKFQSLKLLLLSYEADPTNKNKRGNTPADETSVAEIKKLVLEYKEDKIVSCSLINK